MAGELAIKGVMAAQYFGLFGYMVRTRAVTWMPVCTCVHARCAPVGFSPWSAWRIPIQTNRTCIGRPQVYEYLQTACAPHTVVWFCYLPGILLYALQVPMH